MSARSWGSSMGASRARRTSRMRPSDSPAASPCLRFALGNALPAGQALVLCPVVAFPPRGRPSGRLQPTARRRGSPVLRGPDTPTGRSGVYQVTGSSSSAVPQSTTPPVPLRLAFSASGSAAFSVGDPLSIRNEGFEAAFLRPTRSGGGQAGSCVLESSGSTGSSPPEPGSFELTL